MARASGAVAEKPKGTVKGETKTMPEEEFWKRYSPHYEFPLSHAAAWAIHIIGIVLLVVLVIFLTRVLFQEHQPDVDALTMMPGGGGGNPLGGGSAPGAGDPPAA